MTRGHRHLGTRPCRRSHGATLISLMVGMTLSMLLVSAMMLVFRNLARTTGEALQDARYDNGLVAGFLSSGLALHEAGFGVLNARLGTHLIVVRDASLDEGPLQGSVVASGAERSGNLVVWQQKLGSTLQCSGLLAPSEGGLLRLQPVDCEHPDQWATLNWQSLILAPALVPASPSITITATELSGANSCAPFGIAGAQGHLRVVLSTLNSNGIELTATECLYNFIDPSPS